MKDKTKTALLRFELNSSKILKVEQTYLLYQFQYKVIFSQHRRINQFIR